MGFYGTKIDDLGVNFQSLEVPSLNITAKAYTFYPGGGGTSYIF